jgi:hypothetical protein
MSIVLTTLKNADDPRDNIEIEIEDFEDESLALVQDDGSDGFDLVLTNRAQLQQLVSWAIKERWIDSIPM